MSLGSIAHLQYYFARTGLLDGRSGQMVKKKENGEYDIPKLSIRSNSETLETPIDAEGELLWEAAKEEGEDIMHPPTVSTYRNPQPYVPPPPSQQSLKRELVEALENALHVLESSERSSKLEENQTQGFYEIEGLQILDTTTLAIRAARQYYTQHPNPQKLNAIKADSELRKELYDVLEVLKKAASRNFAGGLREDERLQILIWVSDIGMMIDRETKLDDADRRGRKQWQWLDDSNWPNSPIEREHNFISFLLKEACFEDQENAHTVDEGVWYSLIDGRKLVRMHNAAVKLSKRQFGYIDRCHEDVAKPYRRAENLRFWLKAAELRFETKLKLDVMATVNATVGSESVRSLKAVVLDWAKVVRKDLTKDWNGEEERKLHARARSLALASPIGSPSKGVATKTASMLRDEPESP